MTSSENIKATQDKLSLAIKHESQKFQEYYLWLESAMPPIFFEEVSKENVMLIVHSLMGFDLQDHFSTIHLKNAALVLCLDSPHADLRILKGYAFHGIKNYQAYISTSPLPFSDAKANLRIATIYFTETIETIEKPFPEETKEELRILAKNRNPELTDLQFDKLMTSMNKRFLRSLPIDRLVLALDLYFSAQTRDNCKYEVRYNENWKEEDTASMQIVLAWRSTPKHNFIYRIALTVQRHNLVMKRVNATYINPYNQRSSTLVMALSLHGINGQAAWNAADINDFLRELLTIKYFATLDLIDECLVDKGEISGNMGNFLRSATSFIHQALVTLDSNLYTLETIKEALCRHPELTVDLCDCFNLKFNPDCHDFEQFLKRREIFLTNLGKLDTGHEENDTRRKTILRMAMNFIHHTLKTNFFRTNLTAHSFRLDPHYLDEMPFDRTKKFPELPYAIFFMKGMHFFGFHIRFKDLARGGLRTVYPSHPEQISHERNNIFTECYNLAFTQHLKNKDIPEGGAKGIIFLNPFDRLDSEAQILQNEFQAASTPHEEIDKRIEIFRVEQRIEYLHQAQRSFIESLLTIVNCEADGKIRAQRIVDYWKRPEYLYIGPDENMHDEMIQWIADLSKKYHYKPGGAFISSKPLAGINHKEYGVTSLGVNVYMEVLLKFLGIDPHTTPFTIKMSGGPDGDVAGNQIHNLYRDFPTTAKLLTTVDVSGTIYDPQGLDLKVLSDLFKEGKPIRFYPPELLSEGGLLLDKFTKRTQTALSQQTLCWRKKFGKLEQEWLSGSEMNHILRNTVNSVKSDIFIPAGGRPRTLDEKNVKDFLDETGKPTSKGIVEGANLYLTSKARRSLEKLGVLIIKDSSANKTGVICSSFEVLCGLSLKDEQFLANKKYLVDEILERLKQCAMQEAMLLLQTRKATSEFLTDISQRISERINQYTYQLLDYLDQQPWDNDIKDPLTRCFLSYCLPTLRRNFQKQLLSEIPEHHKKAIVACHLSAQLVYKKGLNWEPSIVDILPIFLRDSDDYI